MPVYNPAEIHALFQHAFNLGDVEALIALYERSAVQPRRDQPVFARRHILMNFDISGSGFNEADACVFRIGRRQRAAFIEQLNCPPCGTSFESERGSGQGDRA